MMRINNLFSEHKDLYVFYRDDLCNLKITKFTGFFPYFYEPDPSGNFESFKGEKLRKIIISNPSEIRKQASTKAFESDILFVKRFMIDKVDVIEPAPIKYCFIDIETLSPEMPNVQEAKYPISCISIYNSLSKEIKTFYLPDYESEYMMLVAFTTYMKKEKFDIWFSWNVKFDYNYLYNRTLSIFDLEGIKNADLAECISPIDKSRYGDGEVKYPAGTSVVDYLEWFKIITLKREKMYTLDYIAQKFLKVPPKEKVDFSKLSPKLKQHNIDDIKLLVGLEELMHLVSYYDEIRRITQVEWEDFIYNSRSIDMLILKEAKRRNIVLPNRPSGEGDEEIFEGAFREIYETGRLENVGKADLGCYSEDTDILTIEGFKKYNELKIGESVASFNTKINKIEFQPILHLNIQNVKNLPMINLKNSYSTDQLLTLNHKVLFKTSSKNHKTIENTTNDWEICYAKDFRISHSLLPLTAEMKDKENYPISDDIIKIHAWIITEGYASGKNKDIYHISQSESINPLFCKEIDESFKNLNWNVTRYARIRKNNRIEVEWNLKWLWSTYIELEENYKAIPLWMLQKLSKRQLTVLYDTLMKGDGDKKRYCYYAIDKLAKERFQYLCALLGKASYQNNRKEVYCKPNKFTSLESANFKTQHKIINYSGVVWCPTIANGFVLVRRKGKIFISGNSAYPYAIIEFCLDPANVVQDSGENIIQVGDNYFKQDSKALIPTIIKKLLVLKATIKKELSECSVDDPNHKNIKLKYDAIKSLCNTAYGVTALKFFRLFDVRVASATTFVVRSLLHYIKDKLDGSGHPVVYIDTDGVFYKNPSTEINTKLNEWIQQWVKETFKKESVQISFDFEGVYESILLLAKCRYVGRLRKNNGELEIETKGIEAKRKDSTKYMSNFQKILIDKILDNEPKEKIYDWIKEEIKNFPKQNIIDISFPCKMAKSKIEYKSVPIFSRALDNTPEFKTRVGDNFYYIYMEGLDETKKDKVLAFDEYRYEHINREEVDWQRMLERNIVAKIDVIFTALKWNLTDIYVAPPTSKICDKCLKDKSFCRFPLTGNTCKACITLIEKANKPKRVKKTIESSISDTLPSDKADKVGQDTPDLTGNTPILTQSTDNKGVKMDKIDDKDLVTGTPVKSLKKRGRPRKIKKPEDLNYGKVKNA
jgi:DNA polymerase elongation subunit (family B)